MSGWQVGDLALCVRTAPRYPVNPTRAGCVYKVSRVWLHPNGRWVLDFSGIYNGSPRKSDPRLDFWGHSPERFRKVTPGTDIEGVEERRRIPVGEPA